MAEDYSSEQISEMCKERAQEFAMRCLGGKPERHGRELVWPKSVSPMGAKVSVVISGAKQGLVMIYDGVKRPPNVLGLMYETVGARDWPTTFDKAREWLGLPARGRRVDPIKKAQIDKEWAQRRLKAEADQQRDEEARQRNAVSIWKGTSNLLGSLGVDYIKSRSISPHHLPVGEVRFHPALFYPGHGKWPGIVARVLNVRDEITAVWRIFLDPKTGGKAPVPDAKLGLGLARGGAVRLGDDGRADEIIVCEGLETGLAIREWTMWKKPVWCGLSTSGMISLEIPDRVMHVTIYPDGDDPHLRSKVQGEDVELPAGEAIKGAGMRAAERLAERLSKMGRGFFIEEEPPVGKDYLDLLAEAKKADIKEEIIDPWRR